MFGCPAACFDIDEPAEGHQVAVMAEELVCSGAEADANMHHQPALVVLNMLGGVELSERNDPIAVLHMVFSHELSIQARYKSSDGLSTIAAGRTENLYMLPVGIIAMALSLDQAI